MNYLTVQEDCHCLLSCLSVSSFGEELVDGFPLPQALAWVNKLVIIFRRPVHLPFAKQKSVNPRETS